MKIPPTLLLVQPPIYDFTAFDLFLYPLGLLEAGAVFEEAGFRTVFVDALGRYEPFSPSEGWKKPTFRRDGCGHFPRQRIDPPAALNEIPRRFHRFGIPRDLLKKRMQNAVSHPAPDLLVGVTCTMTYWYPGVREVVKITRELFPGVPVVLGGVYATLCPDHARAETGADFIVQGKNFGPLFEELGLAGAGTEPLHAKRPAHHLVGRQESAALRATSGCPWRCTYCAAPALSGPWTCRPVDDVLDEIAFLVEEQGRRHIAFHDDSPIGRNPDFFLELADGIHSRGLHDKAVFHTVNGLNAFGLTEKTARALWKTNFKSLRIGFETADMSIQARTGGKTSGRELEQALHLLYGAGYTPKEVGVYVMAGLPGQEVESIKESLLFVHKLGGAAHVTEYAPVPGTEAFEDARRHSGLDLKEPLFHNKVLAPYRFRSFSPADLSEVKEMARELNRKLTETETGISF